VNLAPLNWFLSPISEDSLPLENYNTPYYAFTSYNYSHFLFVAKYRTLPTLHYLEDRCMIRNVVKINNTALRSIKLFYEQMKIIVVLYKIIFFFWGGGDTIFTYVQI